MLEASDREIYPIDIVPTASSRRPFGEYTTTLAMHWDGTYRDRVSGGTEFWTEEDGDYSGFLDKFSRVARHLA